MIARLERLAPRGRWLLPLLAAALYLPALWVPFLADDWLFLAMLEGDPVLPPRPPWGLFHLSLVDGEQYPGGVQGTLFQWWTSPAFQAHFFRPLSSLTHALDHAVWGRFAVGHHATSLAFYAALVAVAGGLYRRAGPPAVALLAGLIFAVDDCHAWPIAWIANRNGVLGVLGAALLLYGHHRWRRGEGRRWLVLSLAGYAAGLASSESAVAGVGYVVAWELCLGTGPWRERARGAAPALGMVAAYLAFWTIGGYGTLDSGLYLNPFEQPARFLTQALPARVPLLLLAALTPAQVDLSFLLTDRQVWAAAAVSAVLVAALLVPLRGTLRRDPVARALLLGAAISLVPISATFAAGRNLLLPTLGLSYVLARAIVDGLRGEGSRGLALLLIAFHLVLAPLGALLGVGALGVLGTVVNAESAEAVIPAAGADDLRVVVLNTQSPMTGLYLAVTRAMQGSPPPAAIWPLVAAPVDQELVRTGPRSLRLRAAEPGYLTAPFETLTRPSPLVTPGEVWRSGGLTVRAVDVVEGRLLAFEASFDRDLDDPSMRLLAWDGERLAPWRPPAVGGCVVLPLPVDMPLVDRARRGPPADACAGPVAAAAGDGGGGDPGDVAAAQAEGAAVEGGCSLDLLRDGAWTTRATLPCPGPEGLGVLSVGDIGLPGELLTGSTAAMQAQCREEPCHLLALPGDLMYVPGGDAARAWDAIWDRTLATLHLPGLGVLGNHEYRHEPDPAGKRAALYGGDGRAGFVLPGPSWTARVARGDEALFALVGLDTDSVANPGPEMPGLGEAALAAGCALGLPTVVLGHHPSSSEGRHHGHEAHVEAAMRATLRDAAAGGCRIAVYLAGHDHDLQAWPPGCEEAGAIGTVVSGAAARGFRAAGSDHLEPCPASGARGSYHAGLPGGGYAVVRVGADASVEARLVHVPAPGERVLLSTQRW